MKKNWKTTLVGLLTAAGYAAANAYTGGKVNWSQVGVAAGVAALGYLSKDFNVSGSRQP